MKKLLFILVALLSVLTGMAQDQPTYQLTVGVSNERGGTPNGSGQYEAGKKVYVYVNLNADYKLTGWTADGTPVEADVTKTGFYYEMPDHDVQLVANVVYNPSTPANPSVDERVFHTLTVVTLPAKLGRDVDTYTLEVGKEHYLSYQGFADYRFTGWYLNSELLSGDNTIRYEMPDHDVTLERRFVYDPSLPLNPGANVCNQLDNGLLELIIDDFSAGALSGAIERAQRLFDFSYDNVSSLIVKGKVIASDFESFWNLKNLQHVDFSRTDLEEVNHSAWNKTGIRTVLLPPSMKKVGNHAFKDCFYLQSITCLAMTPPEADKKAFEGILEGVFLYVPAAAVELYKEAEVWKDFIIRPVADDLSSLVVSLPVACADGRCKDMRLEVQNAKSGVRQKYIVSDRMTYTFDLVNNCTYNVYLVSQQGEVLSQMENIELETDNIYLTLPDLKTLYDVTLRVVQNNGTDVTNSVAVKWFDGEGNYLANGNSIAQLTEGYRLAAELTLSEALAKVCQLPARVEHTVAATGNELTATLQPLEEQPVGVVVVNDADGTYLANAWVQATQLLHGRYSHTVSATTDSYGNCELTLFSGVPATITASTDGFLTGNAEVAAPDSPLSIRLKPITTTRLYVTMEGYDDYNDLTVSVVNNTKETAVGDIHLQYPYIILPEGVDDDDELAITAHSLEGRFADVTQTMTVKDKEVAFAIEANGSIEASYTNNKNAAAQAMVFNSDGRLVDTKTCELRKATFSYLPDGDYTVVMMGRSKQFATFNSLADLAQIGLAANTDYAKKTVSVSRGETAVAEFANVPLFTESRYNFLSSKASFVCTTANPRGGYAATFRAAIDFKDTYAAGVRNLRLVVDYSDGTEFVDGSVVLNTKLHEYAQGTNSVQIDGLQNGDEVKFCVMPIDDGWMTVTAYADFDCNNEHYRQPIGTTRIEVNSVDLVVPEVSPTPDLTINLRNIPYGKYKSVEFYDNGVLIGTIPDLQSVAEYTEIYAWDSQATSKKKPGSNAALRCRLNDPYYYSYHSIQAKLTDYDGTKRLTKTKVVEYNPAAAVVSDVGFYDLESNLESSWGGGMLQGHLLFEDYEKNIIDIGCLSHSVSAKSYSIRPKEKHKDFYYYVHFLKNDYLPNMLKNVVLTKYYGDDQTKDFNMTNWYEVGKKYVNYDGKESVVEPNDWNTRFSFLDDHAFDARYLQYGEPFTQDYHVFMQGEYCDLDELPNNFAVSYEYADDFEFPEDTENNNRYIKMLKKAMAEQDILIQQLQTVTQKMNNELAKEKRDWDYFSTLTAQANDIYKKLFGGEIPALTEEQERLIEAWAQDITPAEREEIWNQLYTDLEQTEAWAELQDWSNNLMTSRLYIPPYEVSEGIWTPSFTYIVGTPNTGNILEDMSDGNWHLDESETDYHVLKYVYVNDKGGDRFIVDYSEHNAPETAGNRAMRKENSGPSASDYLSGIGKSMAMDYGGWKVGNLISSQITNLITKNALMSQAALQQTYEVALNSYLQKPNTKWTGKMLDDAAMNLVKANEKVASRQAMASKATAVAGIALTVGMVAYNSHNAWEDKAKNNDKWDQLIDFVEMNCGDDKDLLDILKQNKKNEDDHDFWNNIYGGAATATTSCLISILAPAAGDVAALVTGGLDVALAANDTKMKGEFEGLYNSSVRAISMTKGCEHLKNFIPLAEADIVPLIDPSGYVYEAVPSNRLQGVTATCFYKDSLKNAYGDWEVHEKFWNAEEFDQVNPQLTDNTGKYGWDVPMGRWQVRYQKDGYEPVHSEWLPVPPPQLEVNIPMVQRTAPELKMVHAYQDGVELLFTKYMQPATLTPEKLKVKVVRGGTEAFVDDLKVVLLDEEAAAKGDTTTYASHLKLTSEKGWKDADEVLLIVEHGVKSYCGVPMQETFTQSLDVEQRIESINVAEEVSVTVGGSKELSISVLPAEAAAGKALRLKATSKGLIEISEGSEAPEALEVPEASTPTDFSVTLDAEGKATVTLTGKMEGSLGLRLTIDGELAEAIAVVKVLDASAMLVATPVATPESGTMLEPGQTVTLTTATEGAQIWYTTDGSCPCDELSTRQLYTAPIAITDDTVLKAMAVKEGWTDSDVATFVYTVDTSGITTLRPTVDALPKTIYDLQGRKVDAQQTHKGVYIVVGTDGMPYKTVKK